MIEKNTLLSLVDVQSVGDVVEKVITQKMQHPTTALSFIHQYVSWNGYFGSGVAALSGKIGRSREIFIDREETFSPVADRSVLVASYIFDAARDEFDDSHTPWRDTHRCLAQAFLKGSHTYFSATQAIDNNIYKIPFWLKGLHARVAQGYGAHTPDDHMHIFRAFGYHLGSELLADTEFSVIDAQLSHLYPELISFLDENRFPIGDSAHNGYVWLRTHSGHGNAVEAEHFDSAIKGVQFAYQYLDPSREEEMDFYIQEGFLLFAADHHDFFTHV